MLWQNSGVRMIFDIETDGFDATKIHCLSFTEGDLVVSTTDYAEMKAALCAAGKIIGHNIIRYDLPVLEKIIGFKPRRDQQVIDTLALSWYVNYDRPRHGLEGYGVEYGVPKPQIDDWSSLSVEEYIHRCEEDVKINTRLYNELMYKMKKLYKEEEDLKKCISYLGFKLDCAADQEKLQWKLDVDKAETHLAQLEAMKADKVDQLTEAMPNQKVYSTRKRPAKWLNSAGDLTKLASDWVTLMDDMKLPHTTETVKVVLREVDANPNSITQVKDWLFSLGWEPAVYIDNYKGKEGHSNFNKEAQNILGARKLKQDSGKMESQGVPQIRVNNELCQSVKDLIERDKSVELLEGLTIINHRLAIFKAFVNSVEDGYVKASIAGFTNTMRFRHARPLVNLPSVEKPWGKEIRGCLIAPEGYVLCGADMVSLEDTTKRHYMYDHDPDYVDEMSVEGFDPHLDLAKHSGKISQSDIDAYNKGELDLKALRKKFKVVNYAATYGVGPKSLAVQMAGTYSEADFMLSAFWERNWSIGAVADSVKVREVNGSSWLQNPISGMYHSLRYEKDKFSTLNQSTGVYCFDLWVGKCRQAGLNIIGQFHDEVIVLCNKGEEENVAKIMKDSIESVNNLVKLNVPLGIDYSFGDNYAEIH